MSAPAFAAGPWSPFFFNRQTINTTQDRRGFYRCTVIQHDERAEIIAEVRGENELVAQGNARLIAAAPELYEAAMTALGLIEPLTGLGEDAIWRPANKAWEALVAATRKARGEA